MAKYLDDTGLAHLIAKFATVAISGSYNDLTDKPNIPAGSTVDTALSSTSTNPVQNKVINTALAGKADVSALADYLPLSGGTMTGAITNTASEVLNRSGDSSWLDIRGGSAGKGARLRLSGPTRSGNEGFFSLQANNGTDNSLLIGKPDGTLTWNSVNIALDNAVVHNTGNEVIAGAKAFQTSVRIQDSNLAHGTNPSETHYTSFIIYDKNSYTANNSVLAQLQLQTKTTGEQVWQMILYKFGQTTLTEAGRLGLAHDANGNVYTVAPTPTTSDNSTKIATTAYVQSNLGSYLPLSGGDVTGLIKVTTNSGSGFRHDHTNGTSLRFGVGSGGTNRGIYQGPENNHYDGWLLYWDSNGAFGLRTENNGAAGRTLVGNPTGNLTWNGTAVSLAGHTHTESDITNLGSYLPLSGGTMTGYISFNGYLQRATANTSYTGFCGGTGTDTGAYCYFRGKDATNGTKGEFAITANNGTNSSTLNGKPDGTLTWGGTAISLSGHTHSYLPLSGGSLTGSIDITASNSQIILKNTQANAVRGTAPSANLTHVYLLYRDKNGKNFSGLYHRYYTTKRNELGIIAYNGTTTDSSFAGIYVGFDADGNSYSTAVTPAATSNGTDIATTAWVKARLANSAAASGYVTIGDIKINWGYYTNPSVGSSQSSAATITFSSAFSSACYSVTATNYKANDANGLENAIGIAAVTKTNFKLSLNGNMAGAYWIAIGK